MDKTSMKRIWQLMDAERSERGILDLVVLIQKLRSMGVRVGIAELREILERLPYSARHSEAALVCPALIPDFIKEYCAEMQGKSVLDPWARSGSLSIPVAESVRAKIAYGITPEPEGIRIASLTESDTSIRWKTADPLQWLDSVSRSFEVVVCCPPFGVSPRKISVKSEGKSVEARCGG